MKKNRENLSQAIEPEKPNAKGRKKRLKKLIIALIIVCVIGAAAVLIPDLTVRFSAKDRIITAEEASELEKTDCILVLGCGVYGETPSHMLEDRLLTGIGLYESGVSDRLLMSGDHGREDYDEVNVMKTFATDRGIESSAVFMDHAGFSTYDSLYRAVHIFGVKRLVIVSQGYHLYRALYIAEKLGLEAYGVSADIRTYVGQLYRDLREILARDKDFVKCIIKPESTYLGETIPIVGDGNQTNDK